MHVSPDDLTRFVEVALANVATEYPYHIVHLAQSDADVRPPRALYPAFYGSYDWHSCVHMHWSLARALALAPSHPRAAEVRDHFDGRLTGANVAAEVRYFEAAGHATFERPYGWAWLLLLAAELSALAMTPEGHAAQRWRAALQPLVEVIRARWLAWLPRAEFPTRAGTHGNSAFALSLAHSYAAQAGDAPLRAALAEAAQRWYGADRRYPATFEPSGDDFLSSGLCEALAVARLTDRESFGAWWRGFEPDEAGLARWTTPVGVSDPEDPKIVHLAGLNLSRAWCWRELGPSLPRALAARGVAAAEEHVRRALPAATSGDYVGTHWLASFALLALTGDRPRDDLAPSE
ncbi:MAG: DUF2891 domain-containing protein [Planctomycetota bacterium]